MKQIKFTKVGMKNYGPYIDPLEYSMDPDTLTLITGPNGIGKTMSLDAIPYTLYGMRSNGARGDDVVNNKIEKNCHTWVEFEINDDKYRVDRYHKYTRLGNTVILTKNGEEIKKGQKDVVPEIERIVLPRKLFMNTIMFGQKVKDFFTDLTDSEKKEIFRKVLALDDYVTYYEKAHEALKVANQKLQELENELNVITRLIENADQTIEEQNKKKQDFLATQKNRIGDLKKQITDLEKQLEYHQGLFGDGYDEEEKEIQNIRDKITLLKSEIDQIDSKYQSTWQEVVAAANDKTHTLENETQTLKDQVREKYESQKSEINEQIEKLHSDFRESLNSKIKERDGIRSKIDTLMSQYSYLNGEYRRLEKSLKEETKICPTCQQPLKNDDHIKEKMIELSGELRICTGEIDKQRKILSDIEKKLETLDIERNKTLDELRQKISDLTKANNGEIKEHTEKFHAVKEKINKLLDLKKNELAYKKKEEKLELTAKLYELDESKLQLTEKIDRLKMIEDRIKETNQSIERLNYSLSVEQEREFDDTELKRAEHRKQEHEGAVGVAKAEIAKINADVQMFEFWKQAFSPTGIPSMLIDESVPFMNERVSYYLDKISNGRYIVSFDTLAETKAGEFRDKISVRVLDTQTQANSRLQFSGGQTRLVDIATLLTLGDLQSRVQEVEFNILLFDEIFDSLDESNVGYVSKVLRSVTKGKSIFIISHRHVDQLEADEVYNYA